MSELVGKGDLVTSIAACGRVDVATGYATSPRRFFLVRMSKGRVLTVAGVPAREEDTDLTNVYQFVAFTSVGAFRWAWDQREHIGKWAWLDDDVAANRGWSRLDKKRTSSRLVVGAVTDAESVTGWSLTWDGFSSALWVPKGTPNKGDRLLLQMVEYVSEDDHGNVAVAAERPCGWGIA